MKMSIGKNILANAVGRLWHAVVSFIFVPFFVKMMGEESYGMVTFFAVLQTVLGLMGVGLQKTIRREFTITNDDIESLNLYKYRLLRSCELIYALACIVIFIICYFGADYFSNKWLHYRTLDPTVVAFTIVIMGFSIGLQLLINLYIGGIYGLDLQVLANSLQMAWTTCKNVGVIPVLFFTDGSILHFYYWMVLCDFIFTLAIRFTLIEKLPTISSKTWNVSDLYLLINIWKYAGGLFLISIGSMLNTQLDKIILSKTLTVVDVGAYNCAFQLGGLTAFIPTVIGTAIFSNISTLLFQNKGKEAEQIFKPMNRLAVLFVSMMASFMALFSYEIILVWTGSATYANIVRYAAPLVILGYMLNAFQQVPYDFLLAKGVTKLNQILLAFCIPYVGIVTYFLATRYGVLGAAIAWFSQLLIATTIYLILFHKVCFNEFGIKWLIIDNYGVFLVSFLPAFLLRITVNQLNLKPVVIVGVAVVVGAVSLTIALFLEKNTLKTILRKRSSS